MATLQEHVEEDDGSSVSKYYRTDSDDSEENDTRSISSGDCKDKGLQLSAKERERNFKLAKEAAFTTAMPDRKKKLPKGVRETISGSWEVRVRYQSSQRYIGTFRTLEQATLANEIARNIFKKDEGYSFLLRSVNGISN